MKTVKMTVGQAVVKFLNNQYVEFDGKIEPFVDGIFTILGHGNVVGLGQALDEDPGRLKVYQGRNEQGMAHACISYAKQKNRRRIIACTSSVGPGAANFVTAAATASVNNIPLLLFPSDTFATRQPDPVLQQVEQSYDLSLSTNDVFKPVARYWDRVVRPEQLMSAMINAMRTLTDTANTGAVVICLPQDVQGESYAFPEEFFKKRVHGIPRRIADAVELDKALALIKNSKHPLLISGGGVRYSESGATVQAFCEEFMIPYAETQAGKSATKYSCPMNMGGMGVSGALAANTLAEKADLVLAVGSRLNDFVTGSKELFRNKEVKFVTINTSEFDSEKLDASRVVGDAKINLEEIGEKLRKTHYKSSYSQGELKALKDEWEAERQAVCSVQYTENEFVPVVPSWTQEILDDFIRDIGGTITESNGVGILREVLDPDAIVVAAAGSLPGDLGRLWTAEVKDTYNMEYGYSCMGYEIAGALGSKLAEPDREVYALLGDGSFLMLNSEITTAIQENAKINVVVFDNAAFGCINNLQMGNGVGSMATEMRYRNEETGKTDGKYINIDFAKVGEGYGMKTYSVKTPAELEAALKDAKLQTQSVLIDAKVLPKTMAEGYKSWWHVGVASTSKSEKVQQAFENKEKYLKNARQY